MASPAVRSQPQSFSAPEGTRGQRRPIAAPELFGQETADRDHHLLGQQTITLSRELAGNAINNLDADPERSILLAMQAVTTTYAVDGTTTKEAMEALHRAVLNSRLTERLIIY